MNATQALDHTWIAQRKNNNTKEAVPEEALQAMLSFGQASQFRKACMSVMAWSLTNEERAKVRQVFISMDTNKKGTITLYELKEALTTKFDISADQVKPIFDALDSSQNDEIQYTEFLAAMCSTRIAMHDDL